ncbi:hypothetical protein O9G_006059 [Rozella allomycis CSF55]|uniref:inositol-1,3,4-trisphosphate 5/6-kinase n=2 Tax=Rozella allomycis (strain CSF55) TaxID=988480 RepID=A0A075ANI6_ROZAC|nr:hypothetical protein O9G_006059 [Rozella allomycis CSF55]|eukprot:EPZ31440.1 hypothetical protein O9G_006059 [Rozella allomycis CSF55]
MFICSDPKYLPSNENIMLQSFIPHYGQVGKIYVIGDDFCLKFRPSFYLPSSNFGLIQFDSQEMPKNFKLGTKDNHNSSLSFSASLDLEAANISNGQLCNLIDSVKKAVGLDLIGIDIIKSEVDKKWYVIDVNYFPGYNDFPDLKETFERFILCKLNGHVNKADPKRDLKTKTKSNFGYAIYVVYFYVITVLII